MSDIETTVPSDERGVVWDLTDWSGDPDEVENRDLASGPRVRPRRGATEMGSRVGTSRQPRSTGTRSVPGGEP